MTCFQWPTMRPRGQHCMRPKLLASRPGWPWGLNNPDYFTVWCNLIVAHWTGIRENWEAIVLSNCQIIVSLYLYFSRIAFVDFDTVEAAQSALKKFNRKSVEGRQISIDFAETRDSGKRRWRFYAFCCLTFYLFYDYIFLVRFVAYMLPWCK